jgi:uncharacterized protein (TIGR03118 family)
MPADHAQHEPIVELLEPRRLLAGTTYTEQDLVSNGAHPALRVDPGLVNPWGLAVGPRGIFVANTDSGLGTAYDGNGGKVGATVRVPGPNGSAGTPTGVVLNDDPAWFILPSGKSADLIYVTEDGTVAGWNIANRNRTVETALDKSADKAVYKGVALARFKRNPFLYVANFSAGRIDVFDSTFARRRLPGSFADPNLPRGYAPFNVQQINGQLFVAYAKRAPGSKTDEVHDPATGVIIVFNTDGKLARRFAAGRALNAPWGMAVAPSDFGKFSDELLIGNFGDGKINAFDPATGAFLGQLDDTSGEPIVIDGLWGLAFGNGKAGNRTNGLYFSAGVNNESGGLYGRLVANDDFGYPT